MIIYYYLIYYDFSFSFNTFIGIIIVLLKNASHYVPKEKKGKDNKEIVHKWYKLGISGEICDKSKNCQKIHIKLTFKCQRKPKNVTEQWRNLMETTCIYCMLFQKVK